MSKSIDSSSESDKKRDSKKQQSDFTHLNKQTLNKSKEEDRSQEKIGDSEESYGKKEPKTPSFLQSNSRYTIISIYALGVILIATIFIYLITNMDRTGKEIRNLISTLSPFLGAILIAFLLNPIVQFFDRKVYKLLFRENAPRFRKFLSIFSSYLIALGVLTITVLYVIPQIGQSMEDLAPILSTASNWIVTQLEQISNDYPELDLGWLEEKITGFIPNLLSYATNFISYVFPFIYSLSISIAKIIINILLAIVISCYMLTDKALLSKNCKRLIYAIMPEKRANSFIHTSKECIQIFTRFVAGKSLDSFIIGVLCFALMKILRMPYAILISVIVGITNMIPYFGPFIGAVPGILIYLFVRPLDAIIFAIMILVLQQFDGLILGPKILGDSTGLKPLWVIFAITLGGAYAGVIGMFLGVPVVAIISYLLNNFITSRLKKKQLDSKF